MTAAEREFRGARVARHRRVRARVFGTAERPRLAVYRSLDHIYAQLIDDVAGRTLVTASSLEFRKAPGKKSEPGSGSARPGETAGPGQAATLASRKSKSELSAQVGTRLGERAVAAGLKHAIFDRGGFKYHGRVKALADTARAAGLRF